MMIFSHIQGFCQWPMHGGEFPDSTSEIDSVPGWIYHTMNEDIPDILICCPCTHPCKSIYVLGYQKIYIQYTSNIS